MSIMGEHLATCPVGVVAWADCCCGDALAEAGEGYGARGCAAEGCGAILAYPDEGTACEAHTCAECGGVLPPNPALALVEGYACDKCYGGRWDK